MHCPRAAVAVATSYLPDFSAEAEKSVHATEGCWFKVRQSTATIKKRYTQMGIGGCGFSAALVGFCEIKALINKRLAVTRNFRAADGASTQNFDRGGAPAIPASAPGGGIAGAKL